MSAVVHDKVMHAKVPVPGAFFLPGLSGPTLFHGRIPNTCVDEISQAGFQMHSKMIAFSDFKVDCKLNNRACTCYIQLYPPHDSCTEPVALLE